jgi:hypothetical protein
MTPEDLLMRFEMVKPSGSDAWVCNCPNPVHKRHERRLAIAIKDGVILMHCFACMDTHAILSAVGLELADLYPERIKDPSPEARAKAREAFHRAAWKAALRVLSRETTVIESAAFKGLASDADRARFRLARARIDDCRSVLSQGWSSHTDDAAERDLATVKRARRAA